MPETTAGRPSIRALTRREFVALGAAAAGAAALTGEALGAPARADRESGGAETRRLTLPAEPSQNPAFMARAGADGGLLLWRAEPAGKAGGFRLNRAGRAVWRLCDGTRDAAAIGAEYGRRGAGPAAQGAAFVARLLELGVVVAGGSVAAAPGFPTPPPGGCYHRRVEPGDPVSS